MVEKFRFIDIGGGPDRGRFPMRNLRGVNLARNNPHEEYMILDPSIPSRQARNLQKKLPNLHFVIGGIFDKPFEAKFLPFQDNTFDIAEMNFVLRPMLAHHEVETIRRQESPTHITRISYTDEPIFFHGLPAPYLHAIQETSRILKEDGKLILREMWPNMRYIMQFLNINDNLNLDAPFLSHECRLKPQSLIELTKRSRESSPEAKINQYTRSFLKSVGKKMPDDLKVFALEFRKVS